MPEFPSIIRAISAAVCVLAPSIALAHHPVGGAMPTGLADGFLSGLGHPILGIDHFVTLAGSALIAAQARVIWPMIAFGIALLVGVLANVAGVSLPAIEALNGVTAILVGATLVFATHGAPTPWLAAVAAFGILHGMALGETVVGAETTPILAYLTGLAVVQAIFFAALMWGFRRMSGLSAQARPMVVRASGLAIALAGTAALSLSIMA